MFGPEYGPNARLQGCGPARLTLLGVDLGRWAVEDGVSTEGERFGALDGRSFGRGVWSRKRGWTQAAGGRL